jgi:hypothetical protein
VATITVIGASAAVAHAIKLIIRFSTPREEPAMTADRQREMESEYAKSKYNIDA